MFGLNNISVLTAYLLSILSALLCVIYGIVNWNRETETGNNSEKGGKSK